MKLITYTYICERCGIQDVVGAPADDLLGTISLGATIRTPDGENQYVRQERQELCIHCRTELFQQCRAIIEKEVRNDTSA
jgi:hypothetical protein